MKAGELFIKCLENEGVKHIFGLPGEENIDMIVESLRMLTNPGILRVLKKNLKSGLREVKKYAPGLTHGDLLPYPAGVRAQAISNRGELIDDFLFVNTERSFNVCNAPSPAATSAIPIGEHVCNEVERALN